MSRILNLVFIIFILSFQSIADDNTSLHYKVKQLLKKSGEKDLNVGIYVKDLTDGSIKFAYHPKRSFIPASVAKIFTAYEALSYLGPDYRFETSLLSNGMVLKRGVLKSDLYIKFSGDPTFAYEDLKKMFEAVAAKTIDGNIVVDGTIFDDQYSAPGGFTWDDQPFYYAAPGSAVIINKNCSEAKMSPSSKVGAMADLQINDPTILKIENNVDTAKAGKECPYKSKYLGENKYDVYGCMVQNPRSDIRLNFALQDNNLMVRDYINKAFKELGMKLNGKIKFATAQGGLSVVYVHKSPLLAAILKDTLEDSCNLSASSIFKLIASKYTNQQASHENGEGAIRNLLKKDGLKGSFVLKDGAGESRYNLVTPYVTVNLLDMAYKNPKIKDFFIDSLAKYGSEGTVKSRDLGKALNEYTYAKTGSLRGVSTLAGYYLPPAGRKYAFAILINNHMIPADKVRLIKEQILRTILSDTHG
jgi:D-alanyl-D-alanine carboxypeptidase/D-alanyl-D-alanine-endopeptidase (penicillin-binding protein 4)